MYIKKNFDLITILKFTGFHIIWIVAWATIATLIYEQTGYHWMVIPWLPLSILGTAVAFYVGFKNNSAYGRLWEARKIWGGLVNVSRMWGTNVIGYVSSQFQDKATGESKIKAIQSNLIKRHIAFLYALRKQLLIPTSWEHVTQGGFHTFVAKRRISRYVGSPNIQEETKTLCHYIDKEEVDRLIKHKNTATQIIKEQTMILKDLRQKDLIDDFRHIELQKLLNEFYTLQGKCERIKKFPLPRQYGSMSFIFVGIFIALLPFGMLSEFQKIGDYGTWFAIPFTTLISWVFVMMELVGDYSENPFEGLGNDIPMMSLCRTIEIDLLEMLGEEDLPEPIKPHNGVLM